MLRSERASVDAVAEPRPADGGTLSGAAGGSGARDCVLSELWAEASDGVGSPLIDIYTETDCSSQLSDDEPTGQLMAESPAALALSDDDLQVLPIAVGEKLIEVVEDDDFGAVAEGGGLIWVVENDVGEDVDEAGTTPAQDSALPSDDAVNVSTEGKDSSSHDRCLVRDSHLQRTLTPKKRRPGTKLKHVTKPASDWRPVKSRKLSALTETGRSGDGTADIVLSSRPSAKPETDVAAPVDGRGSPGQGASSPPQRSPTGSDGCVAAPDPAAGDSVSGSAATGHSVEQPGSSELFGGFAARCWVAARARWLLQLAGIAAEQREHGGVSGTDAALLRLRELAATAAAAAAETVARPPRREVAVATGRDDNASVAGAPTVTTVAGPTRSAEPSGETADGGGDAAPAALPTYVSLMPDAEKDRFKGGFLSQLSLRHVNDPAPPLPRLNRTMRQRLRKRKPAPEDLPDNKTELPSPTAAGRSLLPPARRLKVLSKPGGALLRRSFLAVGQCGEPTAAGGDSSGDEAAPAAAAAARREVRARRRLLDFGQLVEVEGVLDMADTYSGCDEPPQLVQEPAVADSDCSPPAQPPQLLPQRWPRADTARCRVCRKFIARVLLPLHLRLHRTGYHGCDVCGQVIESAAALYRHRLGHEPPRFPCWRCGRNFDSSAKLERHRASVHALTCARCGMTVPTPEQVHEHGCDGREGPASAPPPARSATPQRQPSTATAAAAAAAAKTVGTVTPVEGVRVTPAAVAAATATTEPVETTAQETRAPPTGGKRRCDSREEGLVCETCGKSFLLRFNYTMHMKMVHKRSVSRPATERQSPAICPDSVISCLGDILSPDLYSEIVSVV